MEKESKIYKGISYPESLHKRLKKCHVANDPYIAESTFVKKLIDEILTSKGY